MNPTDLQSILDDHLQNDINYQHHGKTWEELDKLAAISLSRLPEKHQKLLFSVCTRYDLTDVTLITRARFMAQTNLFFLCKLLGYNKVSREEYVWTDNLVHNTHEEICNDFFVRKDPTQKDFESFANAYLGKKERLLLVPRGGFKSTMDMADTVQYIICWPEVTCLILTGYLKLAEGFVGEIKGHFTLKETQDPGFKGLFIPGKKFYRARTVHSEDSMFQILFPEHCIPEEDGKAYEYQSPASSNVVKEPTIFAASIEQNLVGWHVGVLKLDDVVTNENSNTLERIKNINKQVSVNQAMLHPYGFYDKIGTWYDSEDTYGQDIRNLSKAKENGDDFPMKIYIRAAWWPTDEAKKMGKIEEEMTKQDYVLWFNQPGQLTYEFLIGKKKTDPYFAIKYLNDPTQMHAIKFPRELLLRRTISANLIPPNTGMIVTCVDTAYSTKNWADYTVIITALIYGGKFYIIDMKRGRYNEYELPALIAATVLQWKPKRVCIEDSVGVKWLGREIYREMDKLKVRTYIEFCSLGLGSKKNSKAMKAKPVLRFIGDERLLFANSCPSLEELYDELSRFGTAASTHDDIVSALSILVQQFAAYADMEAVQTTQMSTYVNDPKMKHSADQVFCTGKYQHLNAAEIQSLQIENPQIPWQELAAADAKEFKAANFDPLGDLFG